MPKIILILLISACFIASCSSAKLSQEEQDYLQKIRHYGNSVTISKSDERSAWARAQVFVNKYSSMRIQVVTDHIISTFNPNDKSDFAWAVNKLDNMDSVQIDVICSSGGIKWNALDGPKERWNERIFLHFIKTNELPFPNLIYR